MTPAKYADYVESQWFADRSYGVLAAAMGVAGEGGEVVDEIKKAAFHDGDLHTLNSMDPLRRHKVLEELGDVLYYATALMIELGVTYEQVTEINRQKIDARYGAPTPREKA